MYNQFFELRKDPFNMTPNPEFLYLTQQHREALAGLSYAVLGRKGFVVLTGNAGTGKTTLLTRVLQHFPATRVQASLIVNPTLTPAEFLEATLLDFGVQNVPASKAQRVAILHAFLLKGRAEGKISALIVDEAHKISPEVLEEIRLLGNFESPDDKMLQIVLLGQSELDELLDREHLRQFKQRIALRLTIEPLSGRDIEQYMRFRWLKAGGKDLPFSGVAINRTAQMSEGIPRVINVICDNALMQAFSEASAAVEEQHVMRVCVDLRLSDAFSRKRVAVAPVAVSPVPAQSHPIKALERYNSGNLRPSLFTRLASRLGLVQRTEIA